MVPQVRIGDVEIAGEGLARVIDIGAHEFGAEPGLLREQPRLVNRHRRKIEPGDDRAVPRQDQRVEPEMTLQVDQALAGDIAQLAPLDRLQMFFAGEKPLDCVETAAVAPMDRHPLVPIAPIGGEECFNASHEAASS